MAHRSRSSHNHTDVCQEIYHQQTIRTFFCVLFLSLHRQPRQPVLAVQGNMEYCKESNLQENTGVDATTGVNQKVE